MKKCTQKSVISLVTIGLIAIGLATLFTTKKGKKCKNKMKAKLNSESKSE